LTIVVWRKSGKPRQRRGSKKLFGSETGLENEWSKGTLNVMLGCFDAGHE
jgi:hypothetical protein